MTETWLTDSHTDKVWISCTSLNSRSLRIDTSHGIGQQGGGLALVYSNMLNVTEIDEANNRSFQFAIWKVSCKVYIIIIIGIYHPPYSTVNQCTNAMFLEEFTEWLPDQLAKYKNVLIVGDINFHLNNVDDLDGTTLKDTLDTLGLKIHNFPTHRHGNTPHILATEIASSLNITTCQPGPFLSDHCSIECTSNIIREDITRKTVSFRKIKDIATQKFQDDTVNQLEMVNEHHDIDVLVQNLETTLHDILEVHAPLITKSVTFRHKCPWCIGIIKQQKKNS